MIFVDSSFWIALRDVKTTQHYEMREIATRIAHQRVVLITTHMVFAETHAYFSRGRELKLQIVNDFWATQVMRMEPVTGQDQLAAVEILRNHKDKSYSFCDAVSFVIMKRLRLNRVLTLDQHFSQFGYKIES